MPKQKKPKKVTKSLTNRLALPLILLGVFLITIPTLFYLNQTIQLRYNTPTISSNQIQNRMPQRTAVPASITIKAIKTTLPIGETTITNNTWGIYQEGVSHLDISSRPGEKGAIILYGHNTKDRLGSLPYLTKGKEIVVTSSDATTHIYTVVNTLEVEPDQMDVFNQKEETLIIYTCTGFADLQRFIIIAKRKV